MLDPILGTRNPASAFYHLLKFVLFDYLTHRRIVSYIMLGLSGRSKVGWLFGRFDVHREREAWEQGAVAEHFHLHTTLLMEKGGRIYHGANRDRCTIQYGYTWGGS